MLIDDILLNKVSAEAKASPRQRMNYNLHESLDDKVQRLFNAMEPRTIIPIQRHRDTAETMIVLRGQLKLTIYDDDKCINEEYVLTPSDGKYGYHIPKGVWHGVEVLSPNTVMFEVKEWPYAPLANEDMMY
jgi:cupin fold WbuC family metalloprotein